MTEHQALRDVYEAARQVLRFNGVDRARTNAAVDRLDAAIEIVKQFDAGYEVEMPPLTEKQIVACLSKAECFDNVRMSYESGPYDITRPTVTAERFARAIEAEVVRLCRSQPAQPQADPLIPGMEGGNPYPFPVRASQLDKDT